MLTPERRVAHEVDPDGFLLGLKADLAEVQDRPKPGRGERSYRRSDLATALLRVDSLAYFGDTARALGDRAVLDVIEDPEDDDLVLSYLAFEYFRIRLLPTNPKAAPVVAHISFDDESLVRMGVACLVFGWATPSTPAVNHIEAVVKGQFEETYYELPDGSIAGYVESSALIGPGKDKCGRSPRRPGLQRVTRRYEPYNQRYMSNVEDGTMVTQVSQPLSPSVSMPNSASRRYKAADSRFLP